MHSQLYDYSTNGIIEMYVEFDVTRFQYKMEFDEVAAALNGPTPALYTPLVHQCERSRA